MKIDWEAVFSYFSQSSISGLHYICDNNKKRTPKSHRIGWILAVMMCCIMCIWLSLVIRERVLHMNTITSIASSSHHVSSIQFPSVAICNNNKVSKSKFQVIKKLLLIHEIEEEEVDGFARALSSLSAFSTYDYHAVEIESYREIFDILKAHDYGVDNLMKSLQTDCGKFLIRCILQSIVVNCSDYFPPIRTNEGYCCGFNYRGPESFGDSNEIDFHEPDEPIYLSGYQIFGGMTVILDFNTSDYLSSIRPYYGGSVLINDATDFPESSAKSTILQPGKRMNIRMKPWLIESTKDLSYLPEDVRNCLYNEGAGTTDAFYSYNSCLSKCRALLMFKYCGCIPYFYPPIGLDHRRKCIFTDNNCLNKNKAIFFSQASPYSKGLKCDCKPECTDRFYDIDRIPGKINHSFYAAFVNSAESKELSVLSVYYNHMTCNRFNLDVFMQWNDSFGFYGGLMSLFIGGSLLSFMEIVGFLIFHMLLKRFTKSLKAENVVKNKTFTQRHTFEYVD